MRFKQERAREIAEAATESLFVNFDGDKAERLVLVSGKSDLGGWSRGPVADIILAAVSEALEEQQGEANAMGKWKNELQELIDAKEYTTNRLRAALGEIEEALDGPEPEFEIRAIIARSKLAEAKQRAGWG